jgi:hypothetical protein
VTAARGLELVPLRRLSVTPIDAWFELHPGDRPLVAPGERVATGTTLAERLRDARTIVVEGPTARDAADEPGSAWIPPVGRRRDGEPNPSGELLFQSGGRWRIGSGETTESLDAPFAGVVGDVQPGIGLRLQANARGILGREALGGPATGRLTVATTADGELRAPQVDVGAAGAILVAGARMDAEALTRARAVGVRGIVVAALGVKERRDFLASELRGRAGAHGLPAFAILILDGATRRPIASPLMAVLRALEGRTVAIVADPPSLVVDDPELALPWPDPDVVRIRSGPLAGAEGRWVGLAGPRRFPGGVILEAAFVRLGDRPPVAVPLGDLERFG